VTGDGRQRSAHNGTQTERGSFEHTASNGSATRQLAQLPHGDGRGGSPSRAASPIALSHGVAATG
jgi:hypothetical protein